MEKNPEILNELKSISPAVANLNDTIAFALPDQYFNQLADEVMLRIRAMEAGSADAELKILSPLLSGMDKKMPFEVEAFYFEMFPGELLEKIKSNEEATAEDELSAISPLLSGIGKKNPFAVPEGYFESINTNSISGNGETGLAKVIPMKRVNRRQWLNYTAAAVVVGFIGISAWFFTHPKKSVIGNIASMNISEAIKQVPDNEMQKYLEAFSDNGIIELPVADLNESDTETLLGNIDELTDNDLQQYLSETPEIKEKAKVN